MTDTAYDGSIRINTKIDSAGFNQGMQKVADSARTAFQGILLKTFQIVGGIRSAFAKIGSVVSNIFKSLLVGALLFFAISAQKIFGDIRESIQDAIALKGGDVAKQWDVIKNKFVELHEAVGLAFLPLVEAAIPYIQKVVDWLIKTVNWVAQVTAAFFGQKQVLQVIPGSAEKLAKATEKTKKNAQGTLAAFDQINVLQKQAADTAATANAPKVETTTVPTVQSILDLVDKIKAIWNSIWSDPLGTIQQAWGIVTAWFKTNVIDPIAKWWEGTWLNQNIVAPLLKMFSDLWAQLKPMAEAFWEFLKFLAAAAWEVIKTLWSGFAPLLASQWQMVTNIATDAWKIMQGVFESLKQIFIGIIQFIHGVFTGDWREAWTGITNIFEGIVNGWKNIIKGVVNIVIDWLNALLRAVGLGVNAVANALSGLQIQIPDWVPVLGGQQLTFNVPQISVPQIPRLATGAVIPPNTPFMAMLGDQKSGTNIEAPVDLIRQVVAEAIANTPRQEVAIRFTGSLSEVARILKPEIDRESFRRGGSLITSGNV